MIGLAGSFGEVTTGGVQVIADIQRAKPASKTGKNLEIILDASGSMKLPLGKTTRWATALEVFKQVVEKLPDDFNVGLRVYGQRFPANSKKTCTDTKLLLPVQKLNRDRILQEIQQLKPRGETPLVYSVLQTLSDLKKLGGGTVILITDGEETCKGDSKAAAEQLKNAGVDIKLNIVGFTLKGKQVEKDLSAFAEATGGRYYSAQSGDQLTRALLIAATDKFPYVIFDVSGKEATRGETGPLAVDLPPGDYRVVVQAADQELTERVKVTPGPNTVLRVVLKDNRFLIER